MIKRELFYPLLAALLGFVFILISFAAWLDQRKTKKLVKYKLRIGAIILSLTTFAACGQTPQPTCYEMPAIKDTNQAKVGDSVKKDSIQGNVIKDKQGNENPKDTLNQVPPVLCYAPIDNKRKKE